MPPEPASLPALRRHQLAYLGTAGWQQVLARPFPPDRIDCLAMWAGHHWPLVVTRQDTAGEPGHVALGLPAPLAFGRQRIATSVPASALLWLDEFPRASLVLPLLPRKACIAFEALLQRCRALRATPRAYGSYGWQLLTRLPYLHAESDLDLLFPVEDEDQADAVAHALAAWPQDLLRLDGELSFPGDRAVAWREWNIWRAGSARSILVRGLHGATLESTPWIPACA